MKTIFTKSFLFAIGISLSSASFSQTIQAGQVAKFGIDGDLQSDERQNGSFTPAGSHDWFAKPGGAGLGLLDTIGAAGYKAQLQAGANIAFNKTTQYSRYSVQDGLLMLDAAYARDYSGKDKTSFTGTNTKNTGSPASWGTAPAGSNVSDKTDILETFVSMRRNGTVISGKNPSSLIATMALSTLATSGDRYVDFEFYKEKLNYNSATGIFENPGPTSTGGHSVWEFNADGSVKAWGDMTISFSFSSAAVSDIKVLIWTAKADANTINPKNFDFLSGEFYESTDVSGYGYAAIKPNGASQLAAWGAVNTATTSAPVWGSNSKDLGSIGTNYYSANYSAGQLAEAAVDLTMLGLDPATFTGTNPCSSPFSRVLTKSRSSSSFSSALSDFAGPYAILDAPTVPAGMVNPGVLTCSASSYQLGPVNALQGAYYTWKTTDGNIDQSNTDSSIITVSKPGTYILSAAVAQGCEKTSDTLVILADLAKPVANASNSGLALPIGTANLFGGDPVASNFTTPYGGSKGLAYSWTGPAGFGTSSQQNPTTSVQGVYTITVTELRNGCTATASTVVSAAIILPVKFSEFTVSADKKKQINLLVWKMGDVSEVERFVVEKSTNGIDFSPAGYVFADGSVKIYSLKDAAINQLVYYRIKAVAKGSGITYSTVIRIDASNAQDNKLSAYPESSSRIVISYASPAAQAVSVSLVSMNGQVMKKIDRSVVAGSNAFSLDDLGYLPHGVYVVQVQGATDVHSTKIKL